MNMRIFGINFGGQKSVPDGAGKPAQTSSSSSGSWGWRPFKNMNLKMRRQSAPSRNDSKVEGLRVSTNASQRTTRITSVQPEPLNPNSKAHALKYTEHSIRNMRTIDFLEQLEDMIKETGLPSDILYNIHTREK